MRKEKSSQEKYDEDVRHSIGVLKSGKGNYVDPDVRSAYLCKDFKQEFYLAQDGLCGINEIKKYSTDVVADYELIRENKFDLLVWPRHRVSINVMRYSKYRDRIDLLLIDIEKFYKLTKGEDELTEDLKSNIKENCGLGKAYIHPYTFEWLKSFGDFDGFVRARNLEQFIEKEDGEQIEWKGCGAGFTPEYYKALINKLKKY